MSIKGLQQRLTQVGVIRLGEQRISKNNKPYPAKLETFRVTSPSKPLVEAVAGAYGGKVKPWQSPTGPQWEVVTDVNEVPVMVPPQRIDPNMERWGNRYRDRLCDGETEKLSGKGCFCLAAQLAGKPLGVRDACKPTTRMSLMLAYMPGLGTLKLESHGWNAAAELPMLADAIEKAPEPVPAILRVEKREKNLFHPDRSEKDQVEARVFMVPVLIFSWLTPAQAFGGELGAAARTALAGANAERHAIEAAKVESERRKFTPDQYLTMLADAKNIEQVRALWTDAKEDGALTNEVKAALEAKAAGFAPKPQEPPAGPEPEQTPPPVEDDVVDVEVAPDPDQVWAQILTVAGERGWDTETVEKRFVAALNKPSNVADGFELTRFLETLRAEAA